MTEKNETLEDAIERLSEENTKLVKVYLDLKFSLSVVQDENVNIKKESTTNAEIIKELEIKINSLEHTLSESKKELNAYQERQTTILTELNRLKETIMDSNKQSNIPSTSESTEDIHNTNESIMCSMRSIPAPSKVLVDDQKKKDNRLVELKRITKEYMQVSEEEASLRLYKLQKTMIHVVSNLKKYMLSKNEDISKSWKSIDMNTQRVAFDMVEREAVNLGVPLNRCIGYWGARRLISKSWANALRTTKKHIKSNTSSSEGSSNLVLTTETNQESDSTPKNGDVNSDSNSLQDEAEQEAQEALAKIEEYPEVERASKKPKNH